MKKVIVFLFIVSVFCVITVANAGNVNLTQEGKVLGQPFEYLQQQIDELKNQLDNIQLIPGPQGLPGPQGEQGPPGPSGAVEVYDANGQYLGILLNVNWNSGQVELYVPSFDKGITVFSNSGNTGTAQLYFQSNDCSGTPYMRVRNTYRIDRVNYSGKHFAGENVAPVSLRINSESGSSMCSQGSSDVLVVPAIEVTLPFTVPVALPLRLE